MDQLYEKKCDCKHYDDPNNQRSALLKMELPEYEYTQPNATRQSIFRAAKFVIYTVVLVLLSYSLWRIHVIENHLIATDRFASVMRSIDEAHSHRVARSTKYGNQLEPNGFDLEKEMAKGTMLTSKNEGPTKKVNKEDFDYLVRSLFDKIQLMHNDTDRSHFDNNMKAVFQAWFPVFDALLPREYTTPVEQERKTRSVDKSSEESSEEKKKPKRVAREAGKDKSSEESSEEKKKPKRVAREAGKDKSSGESSEEKKKPKRVAREAGKDKSSEESSEEKKKSIIIAKKAGKGKSSEESSEEKKKPSRVARQTGKDKSSEESSEEKKKPSRVARQTGKDKSSEESSEEKKKPSRVARQAGEDESSEEKKPLLVDEIAYEIKDVALEKHQRENRSVSDSSEESSEEQPNRVKYYGHKSKSDETWNYHTYHHRMYLPLKKKGSKESSESSDSSKSSKSLEDKLKKEEKKWYYQVVTPTAGEVNEISQFAK